MTNLSFLSYEHHSAAEIQLLAQELRYRGVVPWVDRLPGGFKAGDQSEQEARRVIDENASELVLFLTPEVLDSHFIRTIEIPQALYRRAVDPAFRIVVASPSYGFGAMRDLTKTHFDIDLTSAHGYAKRDDETIEVFVRRVATEITAARVGALDPDSACLSISINTYERMPRGGEALYFDATDALTGDVTRADVWQGLLDGLQSTKRAMSERLGRPTLMINGSKHLTGAFIAGRVFNQYPLSIRQKDDHWRSSGETIDQLPVSTTYRPGPLSNRSLYVEFATGHKPVSQGVDRVLESADITPGGRLTILPTNGRINVEETLSRSLAHHVYSQIDKVSSTRAFDAIHLFVSAPQATIMTLAHLFHGMPEVHFYEWTDAGYICSVVVPHRLG